MILTPHLTPHLTDRQPAHRPREGQTRGTPQLEHNALSEPSQFQLDRQIFHRRTGWPSPDAARRAPYPQSGWTRRPSTRPEQTSTSMPRSLLPFGAVLHSESNSPMPGGGRLGVGQSFHLWLPPPRTLRAAVAVRSCRLNRFGVRTLSGCVGSRTQVRGPSARLVRASGRGPCSQPHRLRLGVHAVSGRVGYRTQVRCPSV